MPASVAVRNTVSVQEIIFLRDLATALLAAAVFAWILQRLGFSAVVGYLLAGVAIGPYSPIVQLVSDLDHIQKVKVLKNVHRLSFRQIKAKFEKEERKTYAISQLHSWYHYPLAKVGEPEKISTE